MHLPLIIACLWALGAQGAAIGKFATPPLAAPFSSLLTAPVVARNAITEASPNLSNRQSALAAYPDGYWLNDLSGKGKAAFNANPGTYKVFRNVREYGAKGKWQQDLA